MVEDSSSPSSPTVTFPSMNPNPTKFMPRASRVVIHIGGIPVEFPFQPYGTQLAFMNRVISTLDRSQKEGHCYALLESPTGTGKTLSLLCSALAWQQNQKLKNLQECLTHSASRADPEAMTDPINHGGGFIPEAQSSGNPMSPPPPAKSSIREKKRAVPTIFYSSRTHAQISQVIREYRKTNYRVSMAVLGSRRHYCTNQYIRGTDNLDEQCKLLLKNRESCPEFKNANKVKSHPSIQKGGCHEVHDIEDLVKIGQEVKGCSYFAARSMAQDAELVFCPYNYIMHPLIRDAMEVNISQNIIIFDEAHNIEDIARDAGSVDLDEEALLHLQNELTQLSINDGDTYQPLFEMTQDILNWIDRKVPTLSKREFQRHCSCWTGDKALKELQEANLTLQNFAILYECARKAIRAAVEAEADTVYLTGMAVITLEGLFSALNYFFAGNGINASNYELALQRFVKKDEVVWTNVLSLWCLNPSVVFKGISELSQSVILTSGTLSPLSTFSSELGVQFGACLEAPHVIDVDSQVWAAAISNGPGNYPLNASFKTADEYAFQDAVGKSLEEIFRVVPAGCLVFFPSYKLLDKLCSRWQGTGQWVRLHAQKSIFVEPRNSGQDSFDSVLREYYDSVRFGIQKVGGQKPRGKRLGLKNGGTPKCSNDAKKGGAAFLAVCRGKVSEGMDFSDDNARAVVVVGIPFPNMYEMKVAQKKRFNDTYETSKKLLNGNEWYCQQAFRALNQAIGRCIRHRFDYGAIIFLDERFHRERNRVYISKWLRNTIKLYDSFEESLESLKSFFQNGVQQQQQQVSVGTPAISNENPQSNLENAVSADKKRGEQNERATQSGRFPRRMKSENGDGASKHGCVSPEYVDLESEPEKDFRCSSLPDDDFEPTVVDETPPSHLRSREVTFETSSPRTEGGVSLWNSHRDDSSSVNSKDAKKRKVPRPDAAQRHEESIRSPPPPSSFVRFKPINSEGSSVLPCNETAGRGGRSRLLCSRCRGTLSRSKDGSSSLVENAAVVSASKSHILSLKGKGTAPKPDETARTVEVVVTDKSCVDGNLFSGGGGSGQGVWCREDGCVSDSVFCPFCVEERCIGAHIVATDGFNVHLQNKIMLFVDDLVIETPPSPEAERNQDLSKMRSKTKNGSSSSSSSPDDLDSYVYVSPSAGPTGGWRSTKKTAPNRRNNG